LDAPDGSPSGGARGDIFFRSRWESAELNEDEAAELLGVSTRTFRRWRNWHDEHGEAGLLDQRLGKASGKRVPVDRAEEVEALYRERAASRPDAASSPATAAARVCGC
jgi:transposase-like protein